MPRFEADIDAMNLIHLGMSNDIYNSVDVCKTVQAIWNHVRRLIQGTDLSKQERDSRLSSEFDKFTSMAEEYIKSFYERFSRLMNDMDRHEVLPNQIAINTKFLNSLRPKWSNYVTMVRIMHKLHSVEYDLLYEFLKQNEVNVNALKAKRAAKVHDPLALVADTYASPSYSCSSPTYYVTHPPSMNEFDDDTQSYKANENTANVQRVPRTPANLGHTPMVQCYNCNKKGHYARESDILEDEELQELNASCIMMAHIQAVANVSDDEPSYDLDFVDDVQDTSSSFLKGLFSNKDHEQSHHEQQETIKPTYDDDQIDINIIIDVPDEGVNSDNVEQDNHVHDQQHAKLESLLINVHIEYAKTQKPNSFYDPSLKTGLGYKNPCRLQKAIAQTPKLYSLGSLSDNKVNVHVHDSEEILKDAEKSRLKLKKKQNDDEVQKKKVTMFLIDYAKLNSLYETFVPKTELSLEQQYFSEASTSNVTPSEILMSESVKKSDSPLPKMLKQSLVKPYFNSLEYDVKRFDRVIKEKTSINSLNLLMVMRKKLEIQKAKLVPKTVQKQVMTKPVTLQTLPQKKKEIFNNINVIKPGMYKDNLQDTREKQKKTNESVLTSTGLEGSFSVSRPKCKSPDEKISVMYNTTSRSSSKSSKRVGDNIRRVNEKHLSSLLNVKTNSCNRKIDSEIIKIVNTSCESSDLVAKTRFVNATPIAATASLAANTPVNTKDMATSSTLKSPKSTKASTPSKYMKEKAQTSRLQDLATTYFLKDNSSMEIFKLLSVQRLVIVRI
ncbi:integrase, catalytic region, zinc finger, CCHC-type containing protein [Tanacetum coccineum]|uniref:Integrase, catalytic region, zinc finger, CCHC-type containing protein n=1 Tax=Tanacetum coccineum TaxID=301880 RepID=A0ABQ5HGM6_9ASTR